MKAVILAGGLGTRIAEESDTKPKPMVEIGGKPLLWHIMRSYANHGIKDFVICLGYKGYVIKEFFSNYYNHMSDMTIDLATGDQKILNSQAEDWRITLVDTGAETMTGGRLKRVAPYLNNETFCLTYGDGLSDIDISAEVAFHRQHGKLATVAAVQPLDVLACSTSMPRTMCPAFLKSLPMKLAGSMADSSSSSQRSSSISTATASPGNASR